MAPGETALGGLGPPRIGLSSGGTELGTTDEPTDLIPGDPDEINDSLDGMLKLGGAMCTTAEGLHGLADGEWEGVAAEGFRAQFRGKPEMWETMGRAFIRAGNALAEHRDALRDAQRNADEAIRLWKEAEKATREWAEKVDAYNDAVDDYNDGAGPHPGPAPGQDPGEGKRAEAQRVLDEARAAVARSGDQAAGEVNGCKDRLPESPGLLKRLGQAVVDTGKVFATQAMDVEKGAWGAIEGMAKMSLAVDPTTPGNALHPRNTSNRWVPSQAAWSLPPPTPAKRSRRSASRPGINGARAPPARTSALCCPTS